MKRLFSACRLDRDNAASEKKTGGGLLLYFNNKWKSNTKVMSSHCSPDLEYITIKCRPHHLSREHSAVFITAVYIAPDANASTALALLHESISAQQNKYPDAVHIIAGDFNHVNLKTVLPKF